MRSETPTIVSLETRDGDIDVQVRGMTGSVRNDRVVALVEQREPKTIIRSVELAVARIEDAVDHLRFEGAIAPEEIQPEHQRYFAIKEQARRVKMLSERLAGKLSRPQERIVSRVRGRHLPAGKISLRQVGLRDLWQELMAADNTRAYLRELAATTTPYGERVEDHLADIVRETSFLHMLGGEAESVVQRVCLCIRSFDDERKAQRERLGRIYAELFRHQFGLNVSGAGERASVIKSDTEVLVLAGLNAFELTKIEEGTHLFIPAHGSLIPIQVSVFQLAEGQNADNAREEGQKSAIANDLGVIRVYEEEGITLDLRSGLLTLRMPSPQELRAFVLAILPLPKEVLGERKC